MDLDNFKNLFKTFVNDPSKIDQNTRDEIEAVLARFDKASEDQAAHIGAGGTRAGWLTGVFKEVFEDEIPDEFLEYGESAMSVARALTGLAEVWTADVVSQSADATTEEASSPVDVAAVVLPLAAETRAFKVAGAAALHEATKKRLPLEAAVAIADVGVETVMTAAKVATGEKTPLEGLSHLADRSVAVVGAMARTATVVGASVAGTAIGAYLGNPIMGRAVGHQVGQLIAPTVGKLVEQGTRKLARHAKKKLAAAAAGTKKLFKVVKAFAFGR